MTPATAKPKKRFSQDRWMNFFFPQFDFKLFPRMLAIACVGAVVAGGYGILHDQVIYTISPEYFPRLKIRTIQLC